MSNQMTVCVTENKLPTPQDYRDLFADIEPLEAFDIKKEELAAQLSALLAHTDTSRSEFATLAHWKKSRVTALLNGNGNPTFKTLWEFASFLGYEADLHFRLPSEARALEPWNSKQLTPNPIAILDALSAIDIEMQSSDEVFHDMLNGHDRKAYFSIKPDEYTCSLIDISMPITESLPQISQKITIKKQYKFDIKNI